MSSLHLGGVLTKVLVVDNSSKYIALYRKILHDNGFETIEAGNFETARTLFAQHKNDVTAVILACSMGSCPPFNPFPFAQYIREEDFTGVVVGTTNCRGHLQDMETKWKAHFTYSSIRDPHHVLSALQYSLKKSST